MSFVPFWMLVRRSTEFIIVRGLPACIVRVLINLYVGHVIRVSWAGLLSSPFNAVNGVKQGGVFKSCYILYLY